MSSHLSDVWFRTTDLEVVSGSGCMVSHRRRRGVPRLHRRHRGREHRALPSAGRRRDQRPGGHSSSTRRPTATAARCPSSWRPAWRRSRPSRIDTFFFSNSGAEATEAAVKLARHATGRPNVIVVQGGFHGRTYLTMAMTTSKVGVRAGYQPLPAGVFVTSFPRPFAWKVDEATAVERALADLRLLLATQTAPAETAAFVIEPVLGEGGYLPAPPAFVRGARRDLRRARHPVRRRRGADGIRANRAHVRGRALGRAARHHGDGQGHRIGLPDLRDRRACATSWRAGTAAPTAAPTAPTRSAAPPRSRRST